MAFAYDNHGWTDNIDYTGVSGHAGLKSIDPSYDGYSRLLGLALNLKSGSPANQSYGFPDYTPASEIASHQNPFPSEVLGNQTFDVEFFDNPVDSLIFGFGGAAILGFSLEIGVEFVDTDQSCPRVD